MLAEKSGTADNSSVVDLTLNETEEPDGFDLEKCCNYGSPIKVEWDGKVHDFIDGFGYARQRDGTHGLEDINAVLR